MRVCLCVICYFHFFSYWVWFDWLVDGVCVGFYVLVWSWFVWYVFVVGLLCLVCGDLGGSVGVDFCVGLGWY